MRTLRLNTPLLRRTTLLACALLCLPVAHGQGTDYRQRWLTLAEQSFSGGSAQSIELLDAFFGISAPDLGSDSLRQDDFDALSDAGWQRIVEARKAEARRRIDELNCSKLATAKLCVILTDNPSAGAAFIAEQKAAARELALERKLARYDAVFEGLSASDQAAVRSFNLVAFGLALPTLSRDYRERLLTIAREYPADFIQDVRAECALEQADDGQILLPADEADRWKGMSPTEQCRATRQYARELMLVCPENIDPQDEEASCEELLSPQDTPLP